MSFTPVHNWELPATHWSEIFQFVFDKDKLELRLRNSTQNKEWYCSDRWRYLCGERKSSFCQSDWLFLILQCYPLGQLQHASWNRNETNITGTIFAAIGALCSHGSAPTDTGTMERWCDCPWGEDTDWAISGFSAVKTVVVALELAIYLIFPTIGRLLWSNPLEDKHTEEVGL